MNSLLDTIGCFDTQGWAQDVKAWDRDETETLASPAETRR